MEQGRNDNTIDKIAVEEVNSYVNNQIDNYSKLTFIILTRISDK
jgi:hypothetical protein